MVDRTFTMVNNVLWSYFCMVNTVGENTTYYLHKFYHVLPQFTTQSLLDCGEYNCSCTLYHFAIGTKL